MLIISECCFLFVCLSSSSVFLSVCLSVRLAVCLSICLSGSSGHIYYFMRATSPTVFIAHKQNPYHVKDGCLEWVSRVCHKDGVYVFEPRKVLPCYCSLKRWKISYANSGFFLDVRNGSEKPVHVCLF